MYLLERIQSHSEPPLQLFVLGCAGIGGGGAVAAEQPADVAVAQTEHHMGEIHRALPRQGGLRCAPRRRTQLVDRHGERRRRGRFHQPADAGGVVVQRRPAPRPPWFVQGFDQGHPRPPQVGLFPYIIPEITAARISLWRRGYLSDIIYVFSILAENARATIHINRIFIRNYYATHAPKTNPPRRAAAATLLERGAGYLTRRRRCWPSPICLASCERAAA